MSETTGREALAEVLADTFDEWLHRMHGVTSSCRHEDEGDALADAALAHIAAVLSDEATVEAVGEAIREAQVDGRVEYKRRVGYNGRLSLAHAALAVVAERFGIEADR